MAEDPAQQAAAGLLADLEQYTEPEETNEAPEAEAEVEQPQDEVEVPEISWETPAELQELLEAPDFEDDDEDELRVTDEPSLVSNTWDEEEDPEKAALQRKIAKLEKKAAWAEEQKIKASRRGWADEARKYFQFSNPDLIEAKSRRAFLKQAQAQHEAVAKVAKPVFDQIAELKQKAKEEALAEARAEAEQRWGAPITGPQAQTNLETTQTMRRERLQQGQSLTSVIKSKFKNGEVNL